ncbi:hypothetical protein, partial [Staphylococcus aureus]
MPCHDLRVTPILWAFCKIVLSVLSLPIFLYAVIKFFFSAKRKNFYANNS